MPIKRVRPDAAANNAGCDRCGTNDREPGHVMCRPCLENIVELCQRVGYPVTMSLPIKFIPIVTQPHAAQALGQLEPADKGPLRNRLFMLSDDQGNEIVMTGAEIDSLAKQWKDRVEKFR